MQEFEPNLLTTAILYLDDRGMCLGSNDLFLRTFGLDSVKGLGWEQCFPKDLVDAIQEDGRSILPDQERVRTFNVGRTNRRLIRVEWINEARTMAQLSIHQLTAEGAPQRGFDSVTISQYVDAVPSPVLVFDEMGRLVLMNKGFIQQFQLTEGELLTMYKRFSLFGDRFISFGTMFDQIRKAFNGETVRLDNMEYYRPEREKTYYFNCTLVPMKGDNDQIFLVVNIQDMTKLRETRDSVLQQVLMIEEDERSRIGRELHDGVVQIMVAASLNLKNALARVKQECQGDFPSLEKAVSLVSHAINETRSISHGLMSPVIVQRGLFGALKGMGTALSSVEDVQIRVTGSVESDRIPMERQESMYRIIQELVNNAMRHSYARNVEISLNQNDQSLLIQVKDDGVGAELNFSSQDKLGGLQNIAQRVESMEGRMSISPNQPSGLWVNLVFPNIVEARELSSMN